ncbi:mannose-1-phosphate guanylyltransferase/mannose-6-phosphate isomerase [Castellaniella caeni]|uniref:mannose-1-phosphate guanylyltransferase/mannose-6-phosphate isomerase n=1 Tax=Castellaniella caeni TaxID=266123 RepID=UPI000835C316|nr:mannose-1-phosphate guanylyltransferase/mannose-6-phosphate isomerase [Castellaniella caeni]
MMSTPVLVPCIVAGGSGTRLWPVSRETMPKPFIRLADGQSLLQKTFARLAPLCALQDTVVSVVNHELRYRVVDDCQGVNGLGRKIELILEPFGRNTAAAVLLCALSVQARWGDEAIVLVSPADHVVGDVPAFHEAAAQACGLAARGYIAAFGLKPDRAETGYGYIETGDVLHGSGRQVLRFVEKPALPDAQAFLASGRFLWNSGMFCMQARVALEEAARHAPALLDQVSAAWRRSPHHQEPSYGCVELDAGAFAEVADISFDKAVMEHSSQLVVVPCALQWKDVGSWQSLSELTPPDDAGNRVSGEAVLRDVRDCYVDGADRLIAMIGVHDLAVVDTPDALLIVDKARSEEVKAVAGQLKQAGHPAYLCHRTVNRPWGRYTVLVEADGYKIKRIVVKPGASLSLQSHFHRSEHWVVVSGTAQISDGVESSLLRTNESTFIRIGDRHRLSNPGRIDLVIIEVQNGQYLGEDDIVRYDDDYGRLPPRDPAEPA